MSLHHLVRKASALSARPPVLILLHGVGSNERSMAAMASAFDARFVVVSARSPIALGPDAYAWFHVRFTSDGPVIDAAEAEAGWKALAAFVDEVVARYGADPGRVYLAGFSQGAILALATLLTAPGRVAGAVVMSGRLLPEVLPHADPAVRGKPALIVHGVHDEKLGIAWARTAREQLTGLGVDVAYHELAMGHGVSPESLAIVVEWLRERLDG